MLAVGVSLSQPHKSLPKVLGYRLSRRKLAFPKKNTGNRNASGKPASSAPGWCCLKRPFAWTSSIALNGIRAENKDASQESVLARHFLAEASVPALPLVQKKEKALVFHRLAENTTPVAETKLVACAKNLDKNKKKIQRLLPNLAKHLQQHLTASLQKAGLQNWLRKLELLTTNPLIGKCWSKQRWTREKYWEKVGISAARREVATRNQKSAFLDAETLRFQQPKRKQYNHNW
jgi:hypothetical protein